MVIEGQFYRRNNGTIFRVIKKLLVGWKVRCIRPSSNGKPYTYQAQYMLYKKDFTKIGTEEILHSLAYD